MSGGSSWFRAQLRAGNVAPGTSAPAFGASFSSGARPPVAPPRRPYHERRAEMAHCPECLSEDCYAINCDERRGER